MKRFKFVLSKEYFLTLSLPSLSRKEKSNSVVKILFFFGLNLLFVFFLLLASSGEFAGTGSVETNYFNYFILFILLSFVGYFAVLVLNGSKRLVDPKNFLSVLIFALLSTAAAVLAMPATASNTFGVSSVRGLSGAFILLAIGLFYLINVFVQDRTLLKRVWYTLVLGFSLYFLALVVLSYSGNSMIPNNILNVFPLFLLLGLTFLHSRLPKWLLLTMLGFFGALTLFSYSSYKGLHGNLYAVLISISITALIFSIYFLLVNRKYLKNRVEEIKKSSSLKDKLRLALPLLLLLSPIVIFLFGFIVQIITKQNYLSVFNNLGDIRIAIDNLITNSTIVNSGSRFLVGLGGRVLNPDYSLISNVISSQGILGLVAYLFLGITTLVFGFKLLNKMIFVTRDYKFALSFMFILVYGIVLSFFVYPGLLTLILWWGALGLISTYYTVFIYRRNIFFAKDLGFVLSERLSFLKGKLKLQYLFAFLILIVGVVSYFLLRGIVY